MGDERRTDDLEFLYAGGIREGYADRQAGRPNRADTAPEPVRDSTWARGYRTGWESAGHE